MIKEAKTYHCIYYNVISQRDVVFEVVARNLREAYLIAYLSLDRYYKFEDLNIIEKCYTVRTMDTCNQEPTSEDIRKLDKFCEDHNVRNW